MIQLVLAVFAWAGPVPAGHDHAALVSCPDKCAELADHLERFHDGLSSNLPQGWHLHWMLVGDTEVALTSAAGSAAGTASVTVSATSAPPLSEAPMERGRPGFSPHAMGRVSAPPSFLGTFCCERSLPERLGVLRC